mgnify:CR=1 FL=1
MSKILVTGATGQLGKEVVEHLLSRTNTSNLAVLVREASKTEGLKTKGIDVRVGSYDDYNSLIKAFNGIDKLYFVSGNDITNRTQQHENVVKAAKEAGIKHVVYTSFMRKNETETSPIAMVAMAHIKTEKWLKESGMKYTILKHNIYMDMLPMFIGETILETGILYLPAGYEKVAFTLRSEMAEVASIILTTESHENKIYDITNDKAVSFSDIALIISEISGKTINYVSPTQKEYIKTLTDAAVPMEYIGMFAGFAEAFKQSEFNQTGNDIEILTGRKPTSVNIFLKKVYSKK